jgi:selT/selW/selH-like putative selenoprotein
LLTAFKRKIDALTLVPGDGGCFEVKADGKLLFSKLKLQRFPDSGEVLKILGNGRA